ncbi:hypothetical protein CTI12_AA535130 [Artemisia annua]|uniref:Uncharacterized protein n=1 Tax=Artemisia annua TaxID=35608 RepID=A0A2U1L399_ARTAN|nr:hypothetical protein CTI12_AA535130 [Artemisia annua]
MAGRGKRGASLGKKNYPPESFYIDFDEIGAADRWQIQYMDTWRFLYEDKGDKAKDAQLGKVSGIHRTFRNKLVAFVRLDMLPFDTYKYMRKNLEHWKIFVAYTTSEDATKDARFIQWPKTYLKG